MSGKAYIPSTVDQHIGKRMQLRRTMMGMSLKDLAHVCGVTFQQIQKYESADNRISASRLFEIGRAMQTPVSFFFRGTAGEYAGRNEIEQINPRPFTKFGRSTGSYGNIGTGPHVLETGQ